MILTPEKAKTKWCPWARALIKTSAGWGGYYVASHNRDEEGHRVVPARCIANECMAWRWDVVGWKKVQVPAPDDPVCLEDAHGTNLQFNARLLRRWRHPMILFDYLLLWLISGLLVAVGWGRVPR